jgi:hypothetical protein
MPGEVEQFLQSYGDVKSAISQLLNRATQEAGTPEQMRQVAQAYADLNMSSSATTLRMKIGDAIKARVDSPGTIDDAVSLAAALSLTD